MYLEHFGLRELPFGITPDTSFFIALPAYQEALNTLLIATRNGEGFIKITGEVGTGKSLLCRKFLSTLADEANAEPPVREGAQAQAPQQDAQGGFVTAYIPNPYLEPRALLLALADEFGIEVGKDAEQHQLLKSLNLGLLGFARQRRQAVLCLDEAQAMPLESLEALRLLSNLETEKRKLLQVVLFGQPELDTRLGQQSVRQLKQRITFQYRLGMLARNELAYYIDHRLKLAGYRGAPLFTRPALRQLYYRSGGVPRLTNILAHKAMLLAFGEGASQVQRRHVRAAVADTPASKSLSSGHWVAAAIGALLAGGGIVAWLVLR